MVGLIVLLQIFLLFCIIVLIDSIIKKYFCSIFKYRIVKKVENLRTKYIIQRRFLFWFFWVDVDRYPANLYTLEKVKSEIEKLKSKTKKEVVYKEQ
jgi:hypothetical protein